MQITAIKQSSFSGFKLISARKELFSGGVKYYSNYFLFDYADGKLTKFVGNDTTVYLFGSFKDALKFIFSL